MQIELPITLHANQRAIQNSPALYKVILSGKRFGKTRWSIYALTKAAGLKPGGVFCYIAPTYRQAKNIAWREFTNLIPEKYIKRKLENELLITLVNDAEIRLLGSDNADSLRGIKMNGVVFDEVAYQKKYNWNNIIRGQLLGEQQANGTYSDPGFAYFISSPINPTETMGKDMEDWFPEFYNEALAKHKSGDKTWETWHLTIFDNPTLSKEQINDIKNDSTDDAWNVEYLANPSAFAGHVFSEFDYNKHVKESTQEGILVRGIDWGISHPTVGLYCYIDVKNEKIYFEDEYVRSDNTIPESCEVIVKKTGSRKVEWTIADPSLHKRNSVTGIPDIQEFNKNGVPCIAGDNNSRGYDIVKGFLKKGAIVIHPRCKILIKQFRSLQWTDKVNDDCTDAARYICVRVHDLYFKWTNIQTKEEKEKPLSPIMLNFNDVHLFNKNKVHANEIVNEIRSY